MLYRYNVMPKTKISEILNTRARTLSAEIIPPRNGTETDAVYRQIGALKNVPVDFISVTKGAGGSLRGGTLPIAELIERQFGVASLAHFTCRDYSIEEIENALMDHHYFGIKNILALRGDPPDGQPDYFQSKPNRHEYAWQLARQIRDLNLGRYLVREGYDTAPRAAPKSEKRKGQATDFCIGVAAHPEHEPLELAVDYLAKKVEMGAEFAITQMIFSAEPYARFMEECARRGLKIPILPGLRIATQKSAAERMVKKFGVRVPQALVDALARAQSDEEGRRIGLEFSRALCEKLLALGAPGLHVFVMNDAATAAELLRAFRAG
ncbi:MAG: methylenetetrahydrofolate reductase [Deltaproteobacteria bacterium]|nr:methylenetetrahydrofolate reductase [Deltaproteobacteria bacterium]